MKRLSRDMGAPHLLENVSISIWLTFENLGKTRSSAELSTLSANGELKQNYKLVRRWSDPVGENK